jgi:hypothetical protein
MDPIERWTAKCLVALVVSILKGETSVAEAARTHGLTVAEVEEWREKFLLGAENALRSRPKDEQIKKLKQNNGDAVEWQERKASSKGDELASRL